MSSVLAITDDAVLPLSVAVNVCNGLGEDPTIMTNASSSSKIPVDVPSICAVVCISKSEDFPGDSLLSEISRVLKPGGTILVYSSPQSKESVERKLLLNGFVETQPCKQNIGVGDAGIRAKKPSWDIGTSFKLKKSSDKQTVTIQLEDDGDLIDEDSLLTEDDLKKPQIMQSNDCEVGSSKKACKNCSCGRAEAEEKVKLGLTMDQIQNPKSACGNCGLGDAFRCGTCPYKGLPPFKLGDKISISGSFLTADI